MQLLSYICSLLIGLVIQRGPRPITAALLQRSCIVIKRLLRDIP
jgi:hypothetical protein